MFEFPITLTTPIQLPDTCTVYVPTGTLEPTNTVKFGGQRQPIITPVVLPCLAVPRQTRLNQDGNAVVSEIGLVVEDARDVCQAQRRVVFHSLAYRIQSVIAPTAHQYKRLVLQAA